jgi:hypothetical protein
MNLYSIANEYQALLSQTFDPETGEVNEEAMTALDSVKDDIKDKGVAIASYIKNLEAERNAIEQAKKAMAEREARLDKRSSYLAEYLKTNMERCGISVISSPYFEIKIKKNPVSVHIYDEAALPSEYVREKVVTTKSPDKALIKEALQAGVELQCATLRQTTRLEIR